jgi:hypothetical protein
MTGHTATQALTARPAAAARPASPTATPAPRSAVQDDLDLGRIDTGIDEIGQCFGQVRGACTAVVGFSWVNLGPLAWRLTWHLVRLERGFGR